MNFAEYSITKPVNSWVIVLICLIGGAFAFTQLSRFEDPEFTIKDAIVVTQYAGATPQEVEEEVTDLLETEIQQMSGEFRTLVHLAKRHAVGHYAALCD